MSVAFLFPGQGSQYVGMGKDFYKTFPHIFKGLFEEAGDVLGFDLQQYCFVGPSEQLMRTEMAQPAILTVSVGMDRLLREEGVRPDFVAGHSVGQFAALVSAEVLTFADALKIVDCRGKRMAAVKEAGTMVAVVVNESGKLERVFEAATTCAVELAAHNSPTQVVFSGKVAQIAAFQQDVSHIPGVRTKVLQVSHGFHSSLMKEMEEGFAEYVARFPLAAAETPIVLNCDAQVTTSKEKIVRDIRLQCTQPVLWTKTIEHLLVLKVKSYFEVNPSKTLAGLFRSFDARGSKVFSCESIPAYRKSMKKYHEYACL